jgi:hypothetical protein
MGSVFQSCFMSTLRSGFLVLAFVLTLPGFGTAFADTFCVVGIAIPPQCYYDDVAACIGASAPPNTFCSVNPASSLMYYGTSRFCTVQSDRLAQCMFSDFVQCNSVASQSGTICIDRQVKKDDINPFRYERRVEN